MHTFYFFNLRNFYRNCYFLKLYTYKFGNYSCNSIHIYVIYIMQYKLVEYI